MTGAPENRRAPVVGVGAVLVRSDGAVLIGRRIKRGENPTWCLPGGHVEAGETFETAAVREIAEESGLREVAGPRVFAVVLRIDADRTQLTAGVVACSTDPGAEPATPEPEVFDRWTWARPEALPTPLFPASAALLAAWRGRPAPEGWTVYATPGVPAEEEGGR
ncbi:NUDIX domain-containing protein [Streptomyces sp. NPDC006622]|uniref:nucleotide triphosphate diphosphatase NUDT15 n=1 Tax=Streptomyces sp. NPDC006622 TaxID=3155459 RepID=UPI0033A26DA2